MAQQTEEQPTAVLGAIAANLIVAIAKFPAAFFTGSSSMLSEGIHSSVDTVNEGLLLLGIKRSKRPPDAMHPFRHGQELYFWSLIVAIVLFGLGGGMSIYEGILHLLNPHRLADPVWNYVVLGVAFVAEGISWTVALRKFLPTREAQETLWHTIRHTKDPTVITVLFEDSAALAGLVVAFLGVWLSHQFNQPWLDGTASIIIGLILAVVAFLLVYESRGLLIGESADLQVIQNIRQIVQSDRDIADVQRILTMHFGPNEILLTLDLRFVPSLTGEEIANVVARIEAAIRAGQPKITKIFIEVQALCGTGQAQ